MERETAIHSAYDEYKAFDISEPEKNLMRAILRGALDDVEKRGISHKEAWNYIMDNDDSYLYSFISICNHLGICPQRIRNTLGLLY